MNNDWIPVDTSTEEGRQAWNSAFPCNRRVDKEDDYRTYVRPATHGRMAYTNPLRDKINEGLTVQLSDPSAPALARQFINETAHYHYSYRFSWLGLPIIQLPQTS